ncbi:MAG: HD domain-containing phosphohydrolase [Turneriella sp.]
MSKRLKNWNVRTETLNRLICKPNHRHNETANHLKRMSRYSVAIGRAAGLSEIMLNNLGQASMMHDVGKIGIPDAILLKPGKLTEEEFHIMKSHPKIGYQLLSGLESDMIQMAASIALTHHEKFDGSGYPQGLRGEDIPVAGRIVAIADVFDALTTDRPYKQAWSFKEAAQFIRDGSGSQFDPALITYFDSVIDEIAAIHAQCGDFSN